MNRPITLTIAVVLQWISAILGLFAGFTLFLGSLATLNDEVRGEIEKVLAEADVTQISASAIGWGVAVAGLLTIGISIIRVIVAVSLGRGHNWARILITVIVILGIIGGIGGLLGGQWVTSIVSVVLELVILWLLWNSKSSEYIKFKTAERTIAKA
jgi:hypothetical protein